MSEWHEHIPKNGVFCRFSSDENLFVLIKDTQDFLEFLSDYACEPESLNPLTSAEMWQLMPWQTIETAPKDGVFFVVLTENGFLSSARYTTKFWLDGRGEFVNTSGSVIRFVKWLPLPKSEDL
jgi:hypothetical protein